MTVRSSRCPHSKSWVLCLTPLLRGDLMLTRLFPELSSGWLSYAVYLQFWILLVYKSFIRSCLEYGHLLYFSAARSHLERLDALQRRAAGICHDTFPLESRRYAAVVGLTCRLLDGEGRGDLQSFCPSFVTNTARRSSRLNDLSDPARASRLHNPVTFRSLDSFCRSWHAVISTIWDALPANLLLQGQATGWRFVLKDLQRCCY